MRFLWLTIVLVALSVPAFCGEVIEEIAAKVNGDVITKSELEKAKAQLRADLAQRYQGNTMEFQSAYADREKDVLRELIDQQLLIQKGKDLQINVDTEVIKRLDRMRKEMGLNTLDDLEKAVAAQGMSYEDLKNNIKNGLITQQVIGREVGSHLHVTPDEIKEYYEKNKQKFDRPEAVRIREILISTEGKQGADLEAAEKKAQEVLAKVKKGENFADLASQYSDGTTAKTQGGDVGYFQRGKMAPEIEKVAFALKKNETSDLIKTKFGYLIMKVEEKHSAGIPPLSEVEQDIQENLYMQQMDPAMRKYLTKLREEAYIEVKPGYSDSGAVPNTDYARLTPQDMSEDELLAPKTKKKGRSLLHPFRKK